MRMILTSVAAIVLLSAAACGESGNEETTSVAETQDGSPTSIEPYTATGENTGQQIPEAAREGAAQSAAANTSNIGTGTLETSAAAGASMSSPGM